MCFVYQRAVVYVAPCTWFSRDLQYIVQARLGFPDKGDKVRNQEPAAAEYCDVAPNHTANHHDTSIMANHRVRDRQSVCLSVHNFVSEITQLILAVFQ